MASKFIEEIKNMSVMDLHNLVEEIKEEFGVTAAAPVAVATAAAPAAEAAEAKSEFKVSLKDVGSEKIKVIKALRSVVSGLSLKDAKDKAESAPCVIAESASKEDADKMKKELEGAGATVELA